MQASDGKMRNTDVADTEQVLRLIQSIPSPKAEPFKLWLAKVGAERIAEIENPELAQQRIRNTYKAKGYSNDWIEEGVGRIIYRDYKKLKNLKAPQQLLSLLASTPHYVPHCLLF